MTLILAILLYFGLVFGTGFLIGPIRILVLEPMLGPAMAVACEAPILISVMVLAARWVPKRIGLNLTARSLAAMGFGALGVQQFADLAVGYYLRDLTPAQVVATFATPAGAIYAAALVAFALMPLLVNRTKN